MLEETDDDLSKKLFEEAAEVERNERELATLLHHTGTVRRVL